MCTVAIESKTIVPNQYEQVKQNLTLLGNIFRKIYVHDENLLSMHPIFEYVPPAANFTWVKDRRIYEKSRLMSLISSGKGFTEGHKRRNAYMQRQMELNPWIDFYGRQFKPFETKEQPLAEYMYSITIENESYSNYYTEKLMDCFATGTVPIYRGTPKLSEMFNPEGVILLSDDLDLKSLNRDLYFSKMDAVKDNFDRCLKHKKADDVLFEKIMFDIDN